MAGDKASSSTARTPAKPAPKPTSSASASAKQRSIMSFFQKSSPVARSSPAAREKVSPDPQHSSCLQETTKANSLPKPKPSTKLSTPVPSSDAIEPPSSQENAGSVSATKTTSRNLLSPTTMTPRTRSTNDVTPKAVQSGTPTRKVSISCFSRRRGCQQPPLRQLDLSVNTPSWHRRRRLSVMPNRPMMKSPSIIQAGPKLGVVELVGLLKTKMSLTKTV
ncbi:DNA mismatch repair protein msh6 [Metarhizium acridum]|nr:DNA mismatch repair protein msh6 [Metarhizium acridum]